MPEGKCLQEDILGRRKSKCKGPEVREGLECWRNRNNRETPAAVGE